MTLPGQGDFHQGDRYGPGIYAWNGELHVDEEEFVRAAGGDPTNPKDVETARRVIRRAGAERGIPVAEVDRKGSPASGADAR
jgi:hypothetical protein